MHELICTIIYGNFYLDSLSVNNVLEENSEKHFVDEIIILFGLDPREESDKGLGMNKAATYLNIQNENTLFYHIKKLWYNKVIRLDANGRNMSTNCDMRNKLQINLSFLFNIMIVEKMLPETVSFL